MVIKLSFKQVLPIYSDDLSIENTLNLSKYHSVSDNLILSGKFFFKSVNSIDDDVRVSRRVYIPSSKLRGFESGKIGPKDGDEYVGGNFGSALNLNTTLPNILSGYENIDLNLFFDAATLREVDYDSSLESSKIRSSTGISVNWFTVIGPLSFSYAIPISQVNHLIKQSHLDLELEHLFKMKKKFFFYILFFYYFHLNSKAEIVYIDINFILNNLM